MGKQKQIPQSFKDCIITASITELPLKKRGNKRNARVGGDWERENRDDFHKVGYPHVVTSRGESKSRDGQKIDLINKDERVNGRLPYNVQSKNSCAIINYDKIFRGGAKTVKIKRTGENKKIAVPGMSCVPGVYNVILHKYTRKVLRERKTGGHEEVFETVGRYAILPYDDFMSMADKLKRMEDKLNEHGITY